ncbi:Hsp33 family molecular chaperone HslO, partial [Neisseria gonorrhoeae]|uniref:Hsp33 family molecular chaperone HslO n=1 Tax=Neisseria gonorrhoeae TaxID=485 RepID=UPI0027D97D4C
LYRLFHETPPRVFEPETFESSCTCSRGKVSDMLLMLGGEEVGVALVNGIIWGTVMGAVSWLLYGSLGIGLVMVAAMTLNLL